ncbi:Molybdenum-containing formylmethanofuran dehydrogenase 1 subunit C [Bienertia sinuspersici]
MAVNLMLLIVSNFEQLKIQESWLKLRGYEKNPNGSVRVNFSKLMHTGRNLHDDPFVFSSQAKQVFYVEDEIQKGWFHVVKTKPGDLFHIPDI